MKKLSVQYFSIKATMAVVGAAITLLVPAAVHASTSWVSGGNWADDGDNFQTGIIYPTGITSSTTTAQARTVADTIADDDLSVGINFVRIGINPATISGNWSVVQAYVNQLIADGMSVDLGFWTSSSSVGTITDFSSWQTMWETVDGVYHGNNSVYYEPINEPHGYASETVLGTDVYSPFLGFVSKAQNHIILDGQNTADDVTQVGADSRYTGCLLGLHIYPTWWGKYTTESGWQTAVSAHVGSYASRTIMTEMGAPATTGLDYDTASANVDVCFIRGVCTEVASLGVGFAYWPSHRANDTFRLFTSPGGGITNPSLITQLQRGWALTAIWHPWDNPASGSGFTSAFAACSWGALRLDVFGTKSDGNIYHTWWFNNSGWNTWEEHACPVTPAGAPGASANNTVANREDIYFVGTDGNLYHQYYSAGWKPSISTWDNLGAPAGASLVGSPTASSWAAGRYDVYARGADHTVYHAYSTDGTTFLWTDQGGSVTNDVASCSWGANRLDGFALGTGTGAIWHQYWDGSWHPTGTTWAQNTPETNAKYALGASAWGNGRIDLFDNNGSTIGHIFYDSGAWHGDWTETHTPPATPTSAPCATSWSFNRVDGFVLGSDGKCYHTYWGL
ncbi:MAG TPA: hypothetical protein VH280_05040 [Verrucomicrobiae bacterium]|jgi:hypothetical protein|nr:hypothetical protein [Verrucomicrobiae bacterium]